MATLILGVVGAIVGGLIGSAIFGGGLADFWSLRTWVLALIGSLIVLVVWGLIRRRSTTTA
ncbi:putative membrane protein YeaQ/YmgE (transglycosylase-associated protein family) [Microlunatus panaciterrae]|uniref:Membrane protein YeaQ/YmgE (Transglycosylase-associated protein family) n=1 Tax=Microlunatus panaciterrae TaxID=400768 RepID=A0ABS2RF57_9ACTN|nr:putative membrane protein YeaQ/YmgE (transglycosylase-associated protein family) [Microlunatus panaciterrae]